MYLSSKGENEPGQGARSFWGHYIAGRRERAQRAVARARAPVWLRERETEREVSQSGTGSQRNNTSLVSRVPYSLRE